MRRFFINQQSLAGDIALLSEAESHHIASVLRLQSGDPVELFDSSGTVYNGKLLNVLPDRVTVQIISRKLESPVKSPPLYLYQSLLKGKKMDFLVQKTTELGVHSFQPLITRYSENRGNPDRQHQRWQRIMLEACKQCKRSRPMDIFPRVKLDQADITLFSTKILLWEGEKEILIGPAQFQGQGPVCLMLGPEGGFHQDEIEWAKVNGFQSTSLGRLTLRAETAALSATAIVQFLLGAVS